MTGYLNPLYIESMNEWGEPIGLSECNGWILKRQIPGTNDYDAIGPYPIFMCENWSSLGKDLKKLEESLVTLALVTDPFGNYKRSDLEEIFDHVVPFKQHFVTDMKVPIESIISNHHLRYIKKYKRDVEVEIVEKPIEYLDEWLDLYQSIINRHQITGLRTFSKEAFRKQLSIPGMIMFRAVYQNVAICDALTLFNNGIAYNHLMGINEIGYKMGASFLINWKRLKYLKGKVQWINWGGSPGIRNDSENGLSQFKRGWSTGTRTTYFCGKILRQNKYDSLIRDLEISNGNYFPLYRSGEMI